MSNIIPSLFSSSGAFTILDSHVNGSTYSNKNCLNNDCGGNRKIIIGRTIARSKEGSTREID